MKAMAFLSAFFLIPVAFATEDGSVTFDFSQNDGCYTITGSSGAKFTTKWSSCNKNRIWAYGYEVKRVGFGSSLTSLPADPFAFTALDWGLDVMSVSTGGCVVFMNSSEQFLCARVTNVKTRKYDGASADTISFDYRIYDDAQSTVDVVKEKLELAKRNYRAVGCDSGSATFHYQYNDNVFTVEGATGQLFELVMGSCTDSSMYVYDSHVKAIASASSWSAFPASTDGFASLDWSCYVREISTGRFFVALNSAGQYLVGKITAMKRHSDNRADDCVSFDYRIYGTGTKPIFDPTDSAPLTVVTSNAVTFAHTANGGKRTIGTSTTGTFETKWSGCGRSSLYAYRDRVKLLGVYPICTAFPKTRADLLRFDWEQRAHAIPEGGYAAFLNSSGQVLCVRIRSIQSKSWGAAADRLTLDYCIYALDEVLRDKLLGTWTDTQSSYRKTGDSGTVSFRYTCNGGKFSVFGSKGEQFETKWSDCSATSVYAYRDNVDSVATGCKWTSFPSSAEAFAGLDWTVRVVTVREGGWVVFRNKAGGFLCAKIRDISSVDRGDAEDKLTFDYLLYAPCSTVPTATPDDSLATVDMGETDVALPLSTDGETINVKFVKTEATASATKTVDVSECLNIPRLDNGSLDLANAEVKPEIVSEVLDPNQGAKLDFSADKIDIETANTREGLVYEFYESTSLDGLNTVKESKQGDGKPFKPNSSLMGSKSAFFTIKVRK